MQQRQQMTLHHGPSQIITIACGPVEKTQSIFEVKFV